jgi:hypothetical protein
MGFIFRASFKSSVAALALASASPALAAAGGPPIAYALASGQTQSIYLANPDGSGTVKVYTGGSKVNIIAIDIRPGGNQMAILEQSIAGGQGVLKIINYSDAGIRQSVITVDSGNCQNLGVDYHPTDGSLLVSRYCDKAAIQEVRRYYPDSGSFAGDPLVQVTNGNPDKAAGSVRWVNDGSGFLWVQSDTTAGGGIQHYDLSNTSAPVRVYSTGSLSQPNWFDVERCGPSQNCDHLLVTTQSGQIHKVDFSGGGSDLGSLYSSAADGHYSPDNAHILWRQQTKSGYNLMIDNRLFAKASGAKDWRQ